MAKTLYQNSDECQKRNEPRNIIKEQIVHISTCMHTYRSIHTCTNVQYTQIHMCKELNSSIKRSLLLALPWAICNDVSLRCQAQNYSHWKTLTVALYQSPKKRRGWATHTVHIHTVHVDFHNAMSTHTCTILLSPMHTCKHSLNCSRVWPNTTTESWSSPSMMLTDWWFLSTQL